MTIKISEAQVSGFRPLKYGVSLSLNIKDEDLSRTDRDLLEDYWRNGDSVAIALQQFQKEKTQNKRGTLHFFMEQYCEKQGIEIETEKKRLYTHYGIQSRSELTDQQVEYEIEYYKSWTYVKGSITRAFYVLYTNSNLLV